MDKTVIFEITTRYDDPVGTWYICHGCNKQSFIPDFDENSKEIDVFIFCPYCGYEIIKIVGVT